MASPLITGYIAGLHSRLPALIADEAAGGLVETYEHHLAAGVSEPEAARAALADFGDLATVVREFARQAPGRRAARLLLITGPVVGSCWAGALIPRHPWTSPGQVTVLLGFGAALLVAVALLVTAATSRLSYRRTRLTAATTPLLLALDAVALAAALAAPALTPALAIAAAVSFIRITLTARMLPRLTAS
jgi:hypothetical protein